MLKNYFKTALRNILKHKGFSFINIFGLAVGICSFLLIVNYLRFEYSFDDFHQNKDRIYRVPMTIAEKDGKEQTFAFTYPAVSKAIEKDFPEVQATARIRTRTGIIKQGDIKIFENGIFYVDPAFLKIFSFEIKSGNKTAPFKELNDAVITESIAKKYFGDSNPLGKELLYEDEGYTVTAVLKDIPGNSHLQFNILLNYNKYIQQTEGQAETSWGWSDFYTYVLLKPNTDVKALEAKLPAFAQRYQGKAMEESGHVVNFVLQPLKDIHLKSKYDYEFPGNGNFTYLKYLGFAACFILFIAWINYINLSTARSLDRSKEVGIRKVIGASKNQLIGQFLNESFLINLFALILGYLAFRFSIPYFSTLVGKKLTSFVLLDPESLIILSGILIVGTLLSGFYPAFIQSSFKTIASLKAVQGYSGKQFLRRSLVALQFVAAIVLITGALGFYSQLKYMSSRDLGVEINQTLVLQQTSALDSSKIATIDGFLNQLKSIPGIKKITTSGDIPGKEVGNSTSATLPSSKLEKRVRTFAVDEEYIPNYNLTLVAGRNFSPFVLKEPYPVILNETATSILGFKSPLEAVNKDITVGGLPCQVLGVIKDYHQESLRNSFDPIVFHPEEKRNMQYYSLQVETKNLPALMSQVKSQWESKFSESPFQFFFLDDFFNQQYQNDRQFSTVLWLFTVLALIIACMGLFGLTLYTAIKKGKEISIRKVLGATIWNIVTLLSKDYLKLVAVAGCLAIPVAYMVLQNWLEEYAFHVNLQWWFFLIPVVMISIIAIATVSFQAVKAAVGSPVKNLRSE